MGSQTVGHNLVTKQHNVIKDHIYFSVIYKGLHTLPSALLSSLCLIQAPPVHMCFLSYVVPLSDICHWTFFPKKASSHPSKHRSEVTPLLSSLPSHLGYKALDLFFFYDKQHRIPVALVLVGNLKNNKKNNVKLTLYSVTVVCQKTIPGWVFSLSLVFISLLYDRHYNHCFIDEGK